MKEALECRAAAEAAADEAAVMEALECRAAELGWQQTAGAEAEADAAEEAAAAKLAEEAAARLGCEVVQGYGMTELSPVSHSTPKGMYKPGSIGILIPSTESRIVDPETGKDLGLGEDGEIWVRGPQVMPGYLNNEKATKDTIDDEGWLHTGDIGHVDADGHFTIVDRLKELIKFKGFQVPPAELEALLVTHPSVADAAVIGIPDDEAGELPKAFVVLKSLPPSIASAITQPMPMNFPPGKLFASSRVMCLQTPRLQKRSNSFSCASATNIPTAPSLFSRRTRLGASPPAP